MGHYTTSMAQSYTPPSMQQMPPPGVMPNFYNGGAGLPQQMFGHQGPLPPPTTAAATTTATISTETTTTATKHSSTNLQ